jgi:hypothetical protein
LFFNWFKQRRRRTLLAEPFPDQWLDVLARNVRQYACLSDEQQSRLRDRLRVFVAEREWVGCGGMTIDDGVRVTVAAQACLLLLGLEDDWCFDNLRSILVYPEVMALPPEMQEHQLIVEEDGMPIAGQAWYGGPVILSWQDALSGGRHPHDGYNVVLHEFAHQLDALDGEMGGTPPLTTPHLRQTWHDTFEAEYQAVCRMVDRGRPMVLDEYAAASRAELFAVATEHFFEQPHAVRRHHPRLYDLLTEFYRLDPRDWPECHR